MPCLVPVSIYPIAPRASHARKIYQKQRSSDAVATIHAYPVHGAVSRAFEIAPAAACCMTWAISSLAGPATSNWSTRSTAAPNATASSTRTPPNTRCPSPTIPIASFPWLCDSSWRTACPTKPFHVIKELTKAILRAVAQVRKKLAAQKPVGQRGRPTTAAAKRIARRRQRLQRKVADLFEHRHLFVQHDLSPAERRMLQTITRCQPQLRTLRDLLEEVYRLFDRRCRADTALAKLAKLRQRVRRFRQIGKIMNKLRSPNLDKALTFLDDKLFPSTSNAVERGNRRHRKMQKTVYRVRTQEHIHNRIALDMLRESQREDRTYTLKTLHRKRAKAA